MTSGFSCLRAADLLPQATIGVRTRPLRAILSVLGIAIGIAAIVAIVGITRSSQAEVLASIDRLGTNLLTVANGRSLGNAEARLPVTAPASIARTDGVLATAPTAEIDGVGVYRNDRVPSYQTSGISLRAADATLLSTLDVRLAHGVFLNEATARYPAAVLGREAARVLGVATLSGQERIWIGGTWYGVIGILNRVELAPEIDRSALIGFPIAAEHLGHSGHPSRIYVRTRTEVTEAVAPLLNRAADPQNPGQVKVSRPSDALTARLNIAGTTTSLLLGLGAVALLVGAIGVANVMVIAVLERRSEIGLRRALGAARRHIMAQFVAESLLLGATGGVAGVFLGALATYAVAYQRDWQPLIPPQAVAGGLLISTCVGAIAGIYPALRAARLAPTEALRTA